MPEKVRLNVRLGSVGYWIQALAQTENTTLKATQNLIIFILVYKSTHVRKQKIFGPIGLNFFNISR